MITRSNGILATIAICATFIACAAIISRAGSPRPSTTDTIEDIYEAVTGRPLAPTALGPNEFVLMVEEPAVDMDGNPVWIDVVEGDGVLIRSLGTTPATPSFHELRDGTGRLIGSFGSQQIGAGNAYDVEVGVAFEDGLQARPMFPDTLPNVSLMLVYQPARGQGPHAE